MIEFTEEPKGYEFLKYTIMKRLIQIGATVIMALIFIGFTHLMGFENTVCVGMAVMLIKCSTVIN